MNPLLHKDIVIFDLDGTLTKTKTLIDNEMSALLGKLTKTHHIIIISGASHQQLKNQFLEGLDIPTELFEKIHLFPTCGSQCFQYKHNKWEERYADRLKPEEKTLIFSSFETMFKKTGYQHPQELYGEIIEDRITQITFSAVGQKAPLDKKELWNKENREMRKKMTLELQNILPSYEVLMGGLTSIDVTKKGINKNYGVKKAEELLNIPIERMIFIGDDLLPGGNDEPVIATGIDTVSVSNPEDTKNLLKKWLQV